jgi:PAS domain S-box-containing protein
MNRDALSTPALEALLQAPSLAILAVDEQGCVILWSPSASRMFGWSESEVLGRFPPIVPEDQRQTVYDRIERGRKGESISALDVRRLRKDGSLIDVSVWTAPLQDSKGKFIGLLALFADITERKQAEVERQQAGAELSRVLGAVSDCIYSGEFDSDGRFHYHYYSAAAERILGRAPLFFLAGPERWLNAVHPEDRPRLAQVFSRLQSGQSAAEEAEYRIILPDGTIRWVRDNAVMSPGLKGHRFVNGVVSDITARKQAEEALQKTKMELQEVLAAVPDYIWSGQFDPDDRFSYRYNSPAVERIFGRPAEFFLADSKRWLSIVYPEDRSRVTEATTRLRTGQSGAEETEYRIVLPDGAIRWVRDNVVMLPGMEGHRFVNGVVSDITSRKQAEEALQESEARFRELFTGAPVGIVLASPEGRFLQVNPAFCELLGYSEQELLRKTGTEVTHPDDLEGTVAIRRQMWNGEAPEIQGYEKRYLRKDGQVVWVAIRITLIRDATGKANCSIAHVVDITEQKKAEMALKTSEERFRALVEHAFDVIAVVKADATVLFTSASTSRVLGYQPDELMGRCIFELAHPEDLPRATEVFNRLLQTPDGTMVDQFRCRHKDGSWRWLEVSGTNCLGQPHVEGITLNYRDVTPRKQVEAVLRESEERYRLMVEAVPVLAWRTDAAGGTTECNQRWLTYTGQTAGEARGNGWMRALHPDDLGRVSQKVRDDVTGGTIYQTEYRLRRAADGVYRWHLARALPVRDRDGQILCWFGCAVDISDQKRAEEILQESARRAQQRLAAIVESSDDAIISSDLHARITTWNSAAQRLYNYTAEEILGRSVSILVPRSSRAKMREMGKEILRGRPIQHFEAVRLKKGGVPVDVSVALSPIRDGAGNLTGISATYRDMTERKQAQRVQRHLAAIVEYSDDAIVGAGLDGTITSWNTAAQRLYHYAAKEILGRSVSILVPRNRRSEMREMGKKIQRGEHVQHFETVRLKKSGSPVEVAITMSPIKDDAGQVTGVSAIYRDITERKRAEEALQSSEKQYRALVETTDTGYVILDRAGRVLDANAEYVRLTGHRALEEIRGRSVTEWTVNAEKKRNAEAVRTCLKNGYVRNLEINHVDSHGKIMPVEINATVDKTQGTQRVVALCRDISERKALEHAVVEASSREQRRIGQDLHDGLCQQLTGIGFLWKTVEQSIAGQSLPNAATVRQIGRLLAKTIGQARDLAHGLSPVDMESNDLGMALKNLCLSMGRLFSVSCVVQCRRPVRLTDKMVATHLYRITQEAVSNAIHHGKAARVWIYLGWKKNKLTLRVRDNGSGFSQGRTFRHGMGIRSMRYRARVIGASLTLESKRGTGTTLTCVYTQPRSRSGRQARSDASG